MKSKISYNGSCCNHIKLVINVMFWYCENFIKCKIEDFIEVECGFFFDFWSLDTMQIIELS